MPIRRRPTLLRDAALHSVIGLVTYRSVILRRWVPFLLGYLFLTYFPSSQRSNVLLFKTGVRRMMTFSAQTHSRTLASISEVMSSLPEPLAGGVIAAAVSCADNFLSYRNNHPARRVLDRLLQVLLPAGTRSFSLPLAESYPLRVALLRRLAALSGMRELRLSESLHLHTSMDLALSGLRRMDSLAVLHVPWIFSDEMADVVGSSCPSLQVLDASDSVRVTDRAIDSLVRCDGLRVLLLSGCSVSTRGYERLLAELRRLERVGRCQQLGHIVCRVAAKGLRLELTSFESDHIPDEQVAKLCPNLSSVSVSDVTVAPDPEGPALPAGVHKMQVERVGLRDHPMELRLNLTGASLVHLDIMEYVTSPADVVRLGAMCPELQVLRLALMSDWAPGVPSPRGGGVFAPFQRLQEFRLYCGPSGVLRYVLSFARDIRSVTVLQPTLSETQCCLTDAQVKEIIAMNPMSKLRHFCVLDSSCQLTMGAVYALLESCPELREMHDLREWKVTAAQIEELQEVITKNNWDLDLWSHMDEAR